jgi:hippurate hydrolase
MESAMTRFIISGILILSASAVLSQAGRVINDEISENIGTQEDLYKYLHRNPELSFEELNTSTRLSDEIEDLGFEVSRNIGGNGFVGILKNGDGPVIMLRTDMDALPLQEKTGLPFASETPGVMHACGHDMHMTVWLGTAKVLSAMTDSWKGTLMMLAQPAEEKGGGADAMISDGLFKRFPVPDYALAYHVSSELQAGTIGYRSGPFMAGVSSVDVTVHGIGGHGAMPHIAVDPVVLAARMVLAFQTIPSREISPHEPVVVTVGSIHGGTVHNIIPDEVKMQLTIRYFNDKVFGSIKESLKRISSGIAMSAGLPETHHPELTFTRPVPPLINDEALVTEAISSFRTVLGDENVIRVEPVTTAEDFANYGRTGEKIPIAMFWLGSVNQAKFEDYINNGTPIPHLHSPDFYPDFEPTYRTGVLGMSKVVLDLFNK